MHYTVYKITNNIDGKIYIGCHKTKSLDDNYMGSGKYLKRAQKTYGIENFTKEILFVFDNPNDMFAKEAELVNEEFLATENTYNLKVGGFGGWDHENTDSEKQRQKALRGNIKQKWLAENDPTWNGTRNKSIAASNNLKKHHESGNARYDTFSGRSHTEESKKKMSETRKINGTGIGESNSQFGTMWITDGYSNMKIRKTDSIPDGWRKGAVFKK
jgi:group I intron endonuclease